MSTATTRYGLLPTLVLFLGVSGQSAGAAAGDATASATPAPAPRLVFAHYMTCFTLDVDFCKEEIRIAQAHGLDGFAMDFGEWCDAAGKPTRYVQNMDNMFAAANKLYMAGIAPNYNSANVRDMQGLRGYGAVWEGIIRDNADWVEIVTWNDYNGFAPLAGLTFNDGSPDPNDAATWGLPRPQDQRER